MKHYKKLIRKSSEFWDSSENSVQRSHVALSPYVLYKADVIQSISSHHQKLPEAHVWCVWASKVGTPTTSVSSWAPLTSCLPCCSLNLEAVHVSWCWLTCRCLFLPLGPAHSKRTPPWTLAACNLIHTSTRSHECRLSLINVIVLANKGDHYTHVSILS